ncbi:serine/threonine protein kinase [Rhodovulum sp. P5]|uniref:serine/threonine protein kinase n=1 Tax=Rhodovulum sp. P5 TaxID=1564506 RepID=UPI0009C20349|nr:serine/threonine protein kinase [Rhodovulum sp. P5]ARE41195.1 serine/threonine protein kinase [Rhodovulum sp. P5]
MSGTDNDLPDDDDDRTRVVHPHGGTDRPKTDAGSAPPPDDSLAPTQYAPRAGDDSVAPTQIAPRAQDSDIERTVVATPAPNRNSGKLPIGTLINNNYRIDQVLKSGGMGEVYRGIEIHTGDPVAIKAILKERADDAEAGLMFKREARTLRQLSDETIVRYYNYVPDPHLQRYFLVMEFIEGVPLKDYIAEHGALSVEEVLTLLARLAKGLAAAHAKEVIHRDLSPDNVMLARGRVEEARLIDFGIAKSTVVKEGTIDGRFAGKIKYAAPEQLGHFDGKVTQVTDIYGLGLLIAAAAIGKPLDMGTTFVEAVQTRQSVPDLSEAPPELRPILSYMLEPDPAARPPSMLDVKAMAEDPTKIPQQYLGGWVPPAPAWSDPTRVVSSAGGPTMGSMAPGLQVPGMTQSGTWTSSSRSSVGTMTGMGSAAPGSLPPLPASQKSGGGLVPALLTLLLLGALGGGGYYAWSTGLIGGQPTDQAEGEGANAPPRTQTSGIPAPLTDTREGFLAGFETGPCTFVSRVAQGPNAGVIEGYSASGDAFAGLPTAYEEKFGARPEVLPRQVTSDQCAVLAFARALQGRGRNGVELFLSAEKVPSQTPVTAQLTVPSTQSVWLVLISPRGNVYNLSSRLSQPVGNQRSASFALTLGQGVEEAPQLLLAVESDEPLTSAALIRDRENAAAILPRILREIEGRNGASSASLAYLKLTAAE